MLILTLDAGGTNFVFSIVKDGNIFGEKINFKTQTEVQNLEKFLKKIISCFEQLKTQLDQEPAAISISFPGPADFKKGIIGNLKNIQCFSHQNGVALGKMLENHFKMPVFINNDGDLYTLGEAFYGILPKINKDLQENRSNKRYHNLCGMTIGTGFGAGLVHNGTLISGDNICAGEIWITSNRLSQDYNSEEGVSIRALKHFYSEYSYIPINEVPEPKEISEIAVDKNSNNYEAANRAFFKLGQFIGDSIANIITLFDCIVVIGGGIANSKELIIPGIESELKHNFLRLNGGKNNRLSQNVFCLNDDKQYHEFLKNYEHEIIVPFSNETITYDDMPRNGYIFSNFDTSEMICLGAYHFAEIYEL